MSHAYGNSIVEFKRRTENSFAGYGSVFGNMDFGGDVVVRGAFAESLDRQKAEGRLPSMLWMHDPANVPGKYTEMYEDHHGLFVEGDFADTQLGKDTRTLVKMDAVSGLSIGYSPSEVDYTKDGARLIRQAELFEVSIVPIPMNDAARINLVKSLTGGSEREIEYLMRDAGVTRNFAKSVISKVFERDANESEEDAWLSAFKSETDQRQADLLINAIRR